MWHLRIFVFFLLALTGYAGDIQNVVLMVADDAAFETGAYLNRYCQTPNIDNLAKQSLIFNYAFTSVSSCSPSRAQLFTGLPSHESGMYGLHNSVHHFNVFDTVQSLPNILSSHNVWTGIVGKKLVGPADNFRFDYEQTEEHHSINQVGRNITKIKLFVREFLQQAKNNNKPFFLVVGFHDPHRCGHITPEYGEFCELWGSGQEGMGTIPDWTPIYYDWTNLPRTYYLQDTDKVRQEIAAQYMTISRLDQGIGLVRKELLRAGFDQNTLVIYTSDNGPPYPLGRTNLYDVGVREPLIMYSPETEARRNMVTGSLVTLLDIFPTILDAFKLNHELNSLAANYTGKSLLPLLKEEPKILHDVIFGSQSFHEVTMTYAMRMIRDKRYKLIHNINYQQYFPIDQDLYTSPTFQEILNATSQNVTLPWFKTLKTYYIRPEWELYDTKHDPLESMNLITKNSVKEVAKNLKKRLLDWQKQTNDPWICAPDGVLQNQGVYKKNPQCLTLGHEYIH